MPDPSGHVDRSLPIAPAKVLKRVTIAEPEIILLPADDPTTLPNARESVKANGVHFA